MNRYTIYCTEKQTKKALELGAPIKINSYPPINGEKFMWLSPPHDAIAWNNSTNCLIPTAEEMCGWFRTKGIAIYAFVDNDEKEFTGWSYEIVKDFTHGGWKNTIAVPDKCFDTYKEAILAAIDVALEYLISNKK